MSDINWESTIKAEFYDGGTPITIEELYQAFKERWRKEAEAEADRSLVKMTENHINDATKYK